MKNFSDFAEILLEGGGIKQILDKIREDLNVDVAWKERWGGEIFYSGDKAFCERIAMYPQKEITRLYQTVEIQVQKQPMGHLIFNISHSDPREDRTGIKENLKNGVAAIRLFYGQKIAGDRLKSNYRNEFVQDLLYNKISNKDELINRAKTFNWNLEDKVTCLIVSLDGGQAEAVFEALSLVQSRIRAFFPQSVFARLPHSVIFLLSEKLPAPHTKFPDCKFFNLKLADLLETICRDLKQRYAIRALAAIGSSRETPLLAWQSYQEARQALMILQNTGMKKNFVFWDQLGGVRLIATLADMEAAKDFCRQMLFPLMQAGHKNEDLLKTLICLEESNGNLRVASEKLSLHYNSLKYRAGKIWELLEMNPEDAEQRFNLSLALRIYKVLGGFL